MRPSYNIEASRRAEKQENVKNGLLEKGEAISRNGSGNGLADLGERSRNYIYV